MYVFQIHDHQIIIQSDSVLKKNYLDISILTI